MKGKDETVNHYAARLAVEHEELCGGQSHNAIAFCQCETARGYRAAKADPRYVSGKRPAERRTFWLTLLNDDDDTNPLPSGFVGTSAMPERESQLEMQVKMLEAAIRSLSYGICWHNDKATIRNQSDEYEEVS